MINNQFLLFKTRLAFDEALSAEQIKDTSIVFIADQHVIWTHGEMFGGESTHAKGFFGSVDSLPSGETGDWAVVYDDGEWYIYYYDNDTDSWQRGGKYDFSGFVGSFRDYLKNVYDNIYVRKDEVYTPDQWESTEGYDVGGGSLSGSGSGIIANIDQELNKTSFNPVSNWVIYNALLNYVKLTDLNKYVDYDTFESIVISGISKQLSNYYSKDESYNKEEIDRLVSLLPTFDTKVVESLPISDISSTTIYLLKDPDEDCLYSEYMYQDGQWISLGRLSLKIDMGNYVERNELTTKLADKLNKLVSGDNIKTLTVGGHKLSLLGPGNITVPTVVEGGGSADIEGYATEDYADEAASNAANMLRLSIYNDLLNYYSKDETYSKAEVDRLTSVAGFDVTIIDQLPTRGEPRKLYMVKIGDDNSSYETWIYADNLWHNLGAKNYDVDFSEYVTKAEYDSFKNNLVYNIISEEVDNITQPLASKEYVETRVEEAVKKNDVYAPSLNDSSDTKQYDQPGYDPHIGQTNTGSGIYVTWDALADYIKTAITTGLVDTKYQPKNIVLEQAEYEALTSYEDNAIYFVLEPQEEEITNWTFGGTFPITLKEGGVGTFPITLR